MNIKFYFIIVLISINSCKTNHSDMEICFEKVQKRIGSDSVLIKLAHSSVDSYGDFGSMINKAMAEETKSDSTCSKIINKYFLENNENSITVNNLILFQQFQAYLKHERFDQLKAKDIALKYEAKWR